MARVSGARGAHSILLALVASWLIIAAVDGKSTPLTMNEPGCGTLPPDVTSGGVQPHHVPWVVRLVQEKNNKTYLSCVGSLINHRVVLTAAHCVQPNRPSKVQVRTCDHSKCEETPREFLVSSIASHPAYSPLEPSMTNDVALIRLDKDVDDHTDGGNHDNHAVCLPLASFQSQSLLNSSLVVAGWNIHEKGGASTPNKGPLRVVPMPAVGDAECQRQYGDRLKVQHSQLCAGGQGREPCYGDGAAPLHTLVGNKATLAGIVAFGPIKCANSSEPTVYTNVGAHLQWIKDTLATMQ